MLKKINEKRFEMLYFLLQCHFSQNIEKRKLITLNTACIRIKHLLFVKLYFLTRFCFGCLFSFIKKTFWLKKVILIKNLPGCE